MQTYYYVLGSHKFLLEEEPLEEVLFLEAPEMADIKAKCPQPAVAIISTDKQVVTWFKLRLEYVFQGEFQAPTASIPDALKSLATVA